MKLQTHINAALICMGIVLAGIVQAAVPHKINYQGVLKDDNGVKIDATVDVDLRLLPARVRAGEPASVLGLVDPAQPGRELRLEQQGPDGDWVEGCNALVEHFDGTMEILHWPDEIARREAEQSVAAPSVPEAA